MKTDPTIQAEARDAKLRVMANAAIEEDPRSRLAQAKADGAQARTMVARERGLIRRARPIRAKRDSLWIRLLLSVLSVLLLLPIALTFLYSFFPTSEITAYLNTRGSFDAAQWMELKLSPQMVSLRQYYRILIEDGTVLRLFCNSALYTAAILLGQALFLPMMAYALSRFRFHGRETLFFLVLMLMLMPFQVTMVPNVLTLKRLNLMDSAWAIILPMCFHPFTIFLLRQFMIALPDELIEAGEMDGAGTWRSFWHVILPVCRPILGAAAALSFADCWNLVEQPLVYLVNRSDLQPLSVMFGQISESGKEIAFAGAALYILPALLAYLFFQEDILLGIQLSELK